MGRLVSELHEEWMRDADYRRDHAALEDEFAMAETLIRARANAGLTQEQVAERMGTTQSAVARLESGRSKPSMRTLERFADAVGAKLVVKLEERG